jgi:drug/metabolite transporter (DMT)-like permease
MLALSIGLFAALCWSLHDLLARTYAESIGPYRMAIFTLLVGSAVLSGPVLWNGTLLQADRDSLGWVLAMGLVYGIAVSSLFMAFSLAPVSIVGPFTAGYPALVVVWGLYTGVHPTLLQYAAIIFILAGAVVVGRMSSSDDGLQTVAKGKIALLTFYCALACICFAAAVVLGQKASATIGEIETTFLSRIPAAFVLIPFLFWEKPTAKKITTGAMFGVASMALLDVSAVCGINYMGRLPFKELGAMGISAYGAISVLLAMIILKERVVAWQWFGIAIIVVGVAALALPV